MLTETQSKFFAKSDKEDIKFNGVTHYFEHLDNNGNCTYYEDSKGFWIKKSFNENNYCTYYEDSKGLWYKQEYDSNNNCTYYEDSKGLIEKREFDDNNDCIKTTSDD